MIGNYHFIHQFNRGVRNLLSLQCTTKPIPFFFSPLPSQSFGLLLALWLQYRPRQMKSQSSLRCCRHERLCQTISLSAEWPPHAEHLYTPYLCHSSSLTPAAAILRHIYTTWGKFPTQALASFKRLIDPWSGLKHLGFNRLKKGV